MLTLHIVCSVGSLGVVAAFCALAIFGASSSSSSTVAACYIVLEPLAERVVLPVLMASLVTGFIQAIGTPWGVIQHYWVIGKWVLTVLATIVLILQFRVLKALAAIASLPGFEIAELGMDRWRPIIHSSLGLIVLLVPVALSVYKPRGLTRYGWRKQFVSTINPEYVVAAGVSRAAPVPPSGADPKAG